MIFSSLDLAPAIQKALDTCGYTEMTPIQEQAIIPARRGKDLLAIAQTGTGKTAAFSIPILQQMVNTPRNADNKNPRALILTPTRELAEQLASTIGQYAQYLDFTVAAVYGGRKLGGQANKLKAGVDILIATPGRLLEHINECNVDLANIEFVVLDEADRMLDMGFVTAVESLLKLTPKQRQTLLFSATLSNNVTQLSKKLLRNHQNIRVSKEVVTAETIQHVLYSVEEDQKIDLFLELLEEYNWYQVLVFTATKDQANELMKKLKSYPATVIHGDKSQGFRRRALAEFKTAKIQILVSTEIAARGLDIQGLDYVVNFNLPYLAEDYVHRIGRAGRAGQKGHAISFVSPQEERNLDAIQRLIGHKIKRLKRSGYELSNTKSLIRNFDGNKKGRDNRANQHSNKSGQPTSLSYKGRKKSKKEK